MFNYDLATTPITTAAPVESRMLTKRDGTREVLQPMKLIKWNEWASKLLTGKVPWAQACDEVLAEVYDGMSTTELHNNLIKWFLRKGTWNSNRMAGILYAPTQHKALFDTGIPTVKALHQSLVKKQLMRALPYSDAEYEEVQGIIDHKRDFNYAHFQIKHIIAKYSLVDHRKKKRFETPQFTFMRMAMALSEDIQPAERRMTFVKDIYELLSDNVLNAPSPNYIYLGTPLNGLVSCCLYTTEDNIPSLSVGNAIAYRMTAIGAGIGGFLKSRGLGEAVRGGAILHNGKLPYYRSKAGDVKANMQAGRAGAATTYYNIFDVEAYTIAQLQNPRTPANRRNRDMHFAVQYHGLFLHKALMDEQIFTFNCKSAPDLFDAFYSGDRKRFVELYTKYEQDPDFVKNWVSARDLLVAVARQSPDVGTHYEFHADNANRQTPFKEKIYSSNLCVAPETLVTTDKGEFPIHTLKDQVVNVWNGIEWSEVTVRQTGTDQHLVNVCLSGGKAVYCTPYHKWYIQDGKGHAIEVRTHELKPGDRLEVFKLPGSNEWQEYTVDVVVNTGRIDDTYCFTESKRHRGTFNGITTGNCLEIMEVTHAYKEMDELFAKSYLYTVTFLDEHGKEHTYPQADDFYFEDEPTISVAGGELQEGMRVIPMHTTQAFTVVKITDRPQQPETALCSLGGIVEPNVRDDAHYDKAMYYGLHMIDYCINKSDYPFPQIAFTAKKRMNAGMGLVGAATTLARRGVHYDTQEGLMVLQEMSERHFYFAITNSIKLGKERGNAPWMFKTKWPEGWLPFDDAAPAVEEVCPLKFNYNWAPVRADLIANKGMRFSVLVSHMPTESSSKAAGVPNCWYPVRELAMGKSDASNVIDWVAMDSDILKDNYQPAWSVKPIAMINAYAVIQRIGCDQGISADVYADRSENIDLSATDLILLTAETSRKGLKSRYYFNSKTDSAETKAAAGCGSGGCTL